MGRKLFGARTVQVDFYFLVHPQYPMGCYRKVKIVVSHVFKADAFPSVFYQQPAFSKRCKSVLKRKGSRTLRRCSRLMLQTPGTAIPKIYVNRHLPGFSKRLLDKACFVAIPPEHDSVISGQCGQLLYSFSCFE